MIVDTEIITNTIKPIGFIQDIFHSEVLEFLFELAYTQNPEREIILYNNTDRYNNLDHLEKRFQYTKRDLEHFFPDLENDFCEKVIVISYDNLFHIFFTKMYLDKLVFMAHSKKHTDTFELIGANYFALTPLLSKRYMIPFVKDITQKYFSSENPLFDLDHLQKLITDNSLTPIVSIGYFLTNNKDLQLITGLLRTKKILLLIYTPELTPEISNLITEFPDYVYAGIGVFTSQIQYHINFLDIKHLLFMPSKDSKLFTESWSGGIAFAFDNNLQIIMPDQLASLYKIRNGSMITYKDYLDNELESTVEDIIRGVENNYITSQISQLQTVRDNIFNRNQVAFEVFLSNSDQKMFVETDSYVIFNKGLLFTRYEDVVSNLYKKIRDNSIIIDTNSFLGSFGMCCANLLNVNVYNFEKDISLAKLQKKSIVYKNFTDRIKVYNNIIGKKCKRNECIDTLTVDSLKLENVSVIKSSLDNLKNVIGGSLLTITRDHPIIFVTDIVETVDTIEDLYIIKDLQTIGYTYKLIDNFLVYEISE